MKQYVIETPVTYRIEFVNIGGSWYHGTTYYSICNAVRWLLYYSNKYYGKRVVRLYAYRGDLQLRDISQDVFNTNV